MKKNRTLSRSRSGNSFQRNGATLDERQLLTALKAYKNGDFSARLPQDWTGLPGKIADTFNDMIRMNQRLTRELARIARVVGKEGRITQRAWLGDASHAWSDAIGSVKNLIDDLGQPRSERTPVIGAGGIGGVYQNLPTRTDAR